VPVNVAENASSMGPVPPNESVSWSPETVPEAVVTVSVADSSSHEQLVVAQARWIAEPSRDGRNK
jgi:hypothetical protein